MSLRIDMDPHALTLTLTTPDNHRGVLVVPTDPDAYEVYECVYAPENRGLIHEATFDRQCLGNRNLQAYLPGMTYSAIRRHSREH